MIVGSTSTLAQTIYATLNTSDLFLHRASRTKNIGEYYFDLEKNIFNFPVNNHAGKAIFCAGIHNIKSCDDNPEKTHFINVEQTIKAIKHLTDLGWDFIYLSSTQVFSGKASMCKPKSSRDPKTIFGQQKKIVEDYILRNHPSAYIIRMTKILNFQHEPFKDWITKLLANEQVQIYDGVRIAPLTYTSAAQGIYKILTEGEPGVWHLGSATEICYPEIAHFISNKLNKISQDLLNITKVHDKNIRKASLDCTKALQKTSWTCEPLSVVLDSAWNKVIL
jgi:dTDP-4-dehydrorhamnose reductase